MVKRYLVTGHWIDKSTGKPVSAIVEINGGMNKNGQPYEIANTDSREVPIDGTYPVGTVINATMNLSVQDNPGRVRHDTSKLGNTASVTSDKS